MRRLPETSGAMVLVLLAVGACLAGETASSAAVVLDRKQSGWLSKDFAVEPRGRYRLTMRAKVTGPMTVDDNVEFAEAFYDASCPDRGRLFPGWSKVFTGPDGKRGDMHIFFPYWYVFISRHERAYVDEFYVPAGCDTLKVRYGLGGATRVEATEPVLEKVMGETVNVNPRFDCAPHCMAGYAMAGFGSSARMLPRPEGGGSFLRVLEWVYTDPAPVTPGTRYLVRFKLRPDTFSGANNTVTFFDADFKSIPHSGGRVLVRQALKCGEESFVAPPGAACVQILVGSADYESIEILPTEKEAK